MSDNVGRGKPYMWDKRLPIGLYVLEAGEMRPYSEQARSDALREMWGVEGISAKFDDAAHPDFSKGYLVALPGRLDLSLERHPRERDMRLLDDVSDSFGAGLLAFERDAASLRGLFKSYTDAYDANKAAVERMSEGNVAASASVEASSVRMDIAKRRYVDTLTSVLDFCDRAYASNTEVMVPIVIRGPYATIEDYPEWDRRDREEVARTFTFGSDEEVAEQRRSVEMCAMWCNGHPILDVCRAAELIAVTWPERRSDAADLICEAVRRDMVRVAGVTVQSAGRREFVTESGEDVCRLADDIVEWGNDALVALDCAWLMDPEMAPPARDIDNIVEAVAKAEEAKELWHAPYERGVTNVHDMRVAKKFNEIVDVLTRDAGKYHVVFPANVPERIHIPGPVPTSRLEMLVASVASGDALSTLRSQEGISSCVARCVRFGDVEAAVVCMADRASGLGREMSASELASYRHSIAGAVGLRQQADVRTPISSSVVDAQPRGVSHEGIVS